MRRLVARSRGNVYCRGALALVLAAVLGSWPTAGVAHADKSCSTTVGPTVCTFAFTGAAQAWTVPSGITSATFDLYGASGGTSSGFVPGGPGAHIRATLPVTPGETIQVVVGGMGAGLDEDTLRYVDNGDSFNGGGSGGDSGGGGSTDIRRGVGGLSDRLLVAAGGGGGGGCGHLDNDACDIGGGRGGGAGGAGEPGKRNVSTTAAQGGGAGTATTGGAGGAGATGDVFSGAPGGSGALGQGGAGGGAGGGGGGGFYGGGGGGGGGGGTSIAGDGSGGGGGGSDLLAGADALEEGGVPDANGMATITYSAQPTSTTLGLHVTPNSPVAAGTSETLTATVSPSTALGSVTFQDATTPLGSQVTVMNGNASIATMLAPGSHSLSAVFTPSNTAFSESRSPVVNYVVNLAPTSTRLTVTPASPAVVGTKETLTATTSPSTAPGSVRFQDGATPLNDPVTVTNGTASIRVPLPAGKHSLRAVFLPNNTATFSGSDSNTVPYVVYASATAITLQVAPSPGYRGIPEFLLAHLSPITGAGTVQFYDGTAPLGHPEPVQGGQAIVITTALTTGAHTLTAAFTPTNPVAFGPSNSPPTLLTIRALL